jgi:hypothetical protein
MGKIFGDVKQGKPLTERETLQNKYNAARGNLLFAIAFTLINIVLLFVDASSYFLFSIYVPYFIASLGMIITGKMPQEFYQEGWEGTEFLGDSALVVMLVISLVIVGLYFLSWILSKKNKIGWLVFGFVLFCVDTLAMLFLQGIGESIIDLVFHIWVIVYFVIGINSYKKLKQLPEEEIDEEIDENLGEETDACEVETVQNSAILRMADMDAKAKILLEAEKDGLVITYRRVKRVNELVINGNVYDEYEALVENVHALVGVVGGRTVEAGHDGFRSYIKVDDEIIAKKVRLA